MMEELIEAIDAAKSLSLGFPAYSFVPFSHTYVRLMRDELPPLRKYIAVEHDDARNQNGDPLRFAYQLHEARDGGFWSDVATLLSSSRVKDAIGARLGIAEMGFPRAALLHDLPGYSIRPHADTRRKIVTVQVYLSENDEHRDLGVRFYREHSRANDGMQFEQVAQIPYARGHGYFFEVGPDSWHGVEKTKPEDGCRDSLMLIYYRSAQEAGYD